MNVHMVTKRYQQFNQVPLCHFGTKSNSPVHKGHPQRVLLKVRERPFITIASFCLEMYIFSDNINMMEVPIRSGNCGVPNLLF